MLLTVTILMTLAAPALAKPPTLDHLFPAGASRGSTVGVEASGQFERWPARGWASSPGISIRPKGEKGKLSVSVAADVPPGIYWVRLFDDEGATAPRRFFVGTRPEVAEAEPNDEPSRAQRVEATGVVVNGRLAKTGDVDGFVVALKAGQTLVASMEANRRLGSPMDGVLQVASPDGFVLAQNDDEHDRDPQIVFTAPVDGDYLVRAFAFPATQDSSIRFAGGPAFIYRLTITAGGLVDHTFPLAVSADGPASVEAVGWNLPGPSRRLEVGRPGEGAGPIVVEDPGMAEPAEVRVVPGPSIVEARPDDPTGAQPIALPAFVSGHVDPPGDVDTFRFEARKGDRLVFRVESRSIGQALDAVLRVADASGATLAEVDDSGQGPDPEVRFTAPGDGEFRVSVRDLNGHGGPRFAYLLEASPPRPDFDLSLKADQFALTAGATTEIVVDVGRREGFAEPIEVGLADHFDGVIAPPVTSSPTGPSAKSVTLRLAACDCIRPGPIRIVGTLADGRSRPATAPASAGPIEAAWLSVARPAPAPNKPAEKAK